MSDTDSAASAAALAALDASNVVWTMPSRDSSGSMPLGNGDLAANVWVEEQGDLCCYLARGDAWCANGRLLKLGKLRLRLTPNPFVDGRLFRQTLQLRHGAIEVDAGDAMLRIWIDAHAPLLRIEVVGETPRRLEVITEPWRTARRLIQGEETHSAYSLSGGPVPILVEPDVVVDDTEPRLVWYQHNEGSCWPLTLELQGLAHLVGSLDDPLQGRTFGCWAEGDGLARVNATTLASTGSATHHQVRVCALTAQVGRPAAWGEQLRTLATRLRADDVRAAWLAHTEAWSEFWQRSWLRVSAPGPAPTMVAEVVTQGYALQRYMTACAGRGPHPIKANGSLFTVDTLGQRSGYDADYRKWGEPYWFQNTRLVYWPMLAAGDLDLMPPLFRMYLDALPLATERTRRYFGHGGAFFPETMTFWGTYANHNYGWHRRDRDPTYVENAFIRWYYSGALELLLLGLRYRAYRGDDGFAEATLLPLARAVLTFYDQHYPRRDGQLRFEPAAALETWQDVVNPLPEIAGLTRVLDELLALPDALLGTSRADWHRLRGELPPLPLGYDEQGHYLLPAAEVRGPCRNVENPELYAVFPYRLYAVGRPDLEVARESFARRRFKQTGGWHPDAVLAAWLGLTETAWDYVVQNFASSHGGSRFPAFWGPNYDWVPDQDHGSVAMLALQSMLLQADGDALYLLPAWPRGWNVDFRLHAPGRTIVQGVFRDGRLAALTVTPPERAAELVLPDDLTLPA